MSGPGAPPNKACPKQHLDQMPNNLGSSPSALTEELDRLPSLYRRLQSHGESRRVEQPQHQHLQGHHSVQHCTSPQGRNSSPTQSEHSTLFLVENHDLKLQGATFHPCKLPRDSETTAPTTFAHEHYEQNSKGRRGGVQTPPGTRAVIRANLPL